LRHKYQKILAVQRSEIISRIPQNSGQGFRIAVCFSGQIRSGWHSHENIIRYIGDLLPNCDFFVHTWDAESRGTGFANRLGGESTAEIWHTPSQLSSRHLLAKFYEAYSPRLMECEEYHLQPTKNLWGGRRFDPNKNVWHVSMWRSIYEANLLKKQYSVKNNISYDFTVRIRPDIVFGEEKSLFDDIAQIKNDSTLVFGDHYNIWPNHGLTRLEDIFWISSTKVMDEVVEFYDYYSNSVANIDDPNSTEYRDWQWHLANWITNELGYYFYPLINNKMRIYHSVDIDNNVDPLNPGFGNPPGKFT
jgi:hypothetical protein